MERKSRCFVRIEFSRFQRGVCDRLKDEIERSVDVAVQTTQHPDALANHEPNKKPAEAVFLRR
jgi:hypothetical protein